MSFVQAPSLQVLADSMGVPKLSDEAAKALAPDVEYRMRDIIQVQWLHDLPKRIWVKDPRVSITIRKDDHTCGKYACGQWL